MDFVSCVQLIIDLLLEFIYSRINGFVKLDFIFSFCEIDGCKHTFSSFSLFFKVGLSIWKSPGKDMFSVLLIIFVSL